MLLDEPIKTRRLVLANLSECNADARYASWLEDPAVTRYLESRFAPPDRRGIAAYITRMNESEENLLLGMFVDDEHIGNIKLGPIVRPHRRAPIGLLIGEARQWGKGFATEAIMGVTHYAFETLALHKVHAGCYEDNVASIGAFLKAGWREEARLTENSLCDGRWQDDVLLARLNPGAAG